MNDATHSEDQSSHRRVDVILAGHRGDPTVAWRNLSDADPRVRSASLNALRRCGQLDSETLLHALHDTDREVIANAVERCAEQPSEKSLDGTNEPDAIDRRLLALIQMTDESAGLAEVAAWALGERHQARESGETSDRVDAPTDIVRALSTTATEHLDALVRESAVAALGCLGDESSLWAVLRCCEDKATVRRRAVLALAAFDGPEVEAALRTATQDRDWQVRQAAEDLLAE